MVHDHRVDTVGRRREFRFFDSIKASIAEEYAESRTQMDIQDAAQVDQTPGAITAAIDVMDTAAAALVTRTTRPRRERHRRAIRFLACLEASIVQEDFGPPSNVREHIPRAVDAPSIDMESEQACLCQDVSPGPAWDMSEEAQHHDLPPEEEVLPSACDQSVQVPPPPTSCPTNDTTSHDHDNQRLEPAITAHQVDIRGVPPQPTTAMIPSSSLAHNASPSSSFPRRSPRMHASTRRCTMISPSPTDTHPPASNQHDATTMHDKQSRRRRTRRERLMWMMQVHDAILRQQELRHHEMKPARLPSLIVRRSNRWPTQDKTNASMLTLGHHGETTFH
ncbi:Aste57867_18562 [Aphanomyces stellatus]|uniref:Aste57867_18562 protein n=1 Tax=Aphanomyces stellatus TaxID=120398 RepID=A0A485LE73_9STRA|nr:hypothetical protein As57867_018500 [Aphanomyces stellatus]VFT95298.1 Aste57867_18562 [Aphanomyces stellatus]